MAAQACVHTQPWVGRSVALHGCRRFVLRGVALGRLTNATRRGPSPHPGRRAEVGGRESPPHRPPPPCEGVSWAAAEVKSIWPRSAGPHTCHKGRCNGPRWRQPQRTPNRGPSSDCALQVARTKLKPLVIVHQQVTVKRDQALHTPPITLGKYVSREGVGWPWGGPQPGLRPGRSERS